ncbi:hypothetical protein Tco_1169515 [Tanacetum coccineum]
MSDYEDSTVTYTAVSSPFGGLSDIGSLGVVGPEHEGLPWMLDDPYVQVEHVYPEFMPPEDEILLAEEKLLLAADSPTADSPGYIPESNPEEDPEKDGDEDPEEDPVDYPADGGDDRDDKDGPFDDDEDDKVDIEADDEEEEEHPTPAYFIAVALPAIDQALFAEETEPFETDESAATPPPHSAYHVTAMISILAPVPTPVWSDAEISSPPRLISSPVPVLSLSPPASPISPLGYRAAMIRLRAKATSTFYSLPLLPPIILSHTRLDAPSSGTPPMHLLFTNRRADRSEVGPTYKVEESSSTTAARLAGGLRVDYGFVATIDREIMRDPERDVGYEITDSWDEIVETLQEAAVSTDTELGRHMTAFETRVRQDMDEIYTRLDDEQKARLSREAWRRSMDREAVTSEMLKADHRRSAEMRELRTADRTRQQQLIQTLIVMQSLQGQVQQVPAGGLAQPELPEEAGSSS